MMAPSVKTAAFVGFVDATVFEANPSVMVLTV
jgi:hypothetical protein